MGGAGRGKHPEIISPTGPRNSCVTNHPATRVPGIRVKYEAKKKSDPTKTMRLQKKIIPLETIERYVAPLRATRSHAR